MVDGLAIHCMYALCRVFFFNAPFMVDDVVTRLLIHVQVPTAPGKPDVGRPLMRSRVNPVEKVSQSVFEY